MSKNLKKDKAEAKAKAPQAESEARTDAQENQAEKPEAAVQKVSENKAGADQKKASGPKSAVVTESVKTVSAWAGEKRLATWQSAALLRAMGWADDKQVSEEDFNKALGQAMNRRQGGNSGRRN